MTVTPQAPVEGQGPLGGGIDLPEDSDVTFDGLPRCTAKSKQNQRRCRRAATPGQTVCANHGSKSPQAKAKAFLRLAAMADEAIGVLYKEMKQATESKDRQAAANSILDRAGVSRKVEMDDGMARALLYERLMEMRREREGEETKAIEEIVDAEIVDDE
jgi:hypothetical protein